MAKVEWTTETNTVDTERHWLTAVTANRIGWYVHDPKPEEVAAWLAAAPEAERERALERFRVGVMVAYQRLYDRVERVVATRDSSDDSTDPSVVTDLKSLIRELSESERRGRAALREAHQVLDDVGILPHEGACSLGDRIRVLSEAIERLREQLSDAKEALTRAAVPDMNRTRTIAGRIDWLAGERDAAIASAAKDSAIVAAARALVNSTARRQIIDEEQELIRAVKGAE